MVTFPPDGKPHDLTAERPEGSVPLVTTNLDCPEWGEVFSERLLGVATIDRLRHDPCRVDAQPLGI